jgi:hypothetical protein
MPLQHPEQHRHQRLPQGRVSTPKACLTNASFTSRKECRSRCCNIHLSVSSSFATQSSPTVSHRLYFSIHQLRELISSLIQ